MQFPRTMREGSDVQYHFVSFHKPAFTEQANELTYHFQEAFKCRTGNLGFVFTSDGSSNVHGR